METAIIKESMETIKSELVRLSRSEELKSLLSSEGPCLSIYFPVNRENLNPANDERRWKHLLRQLDIDTARYGAQGKEFVRSLSDWHAVSEDRGDRETTLVIFRSPDYFYRMWIRAELPERVIIGPQFYFRPLLPLIETPVFCILALSQKDTRLLRCTLDSAEQVPLEGAKTSFDAYMNTEKPDHIRDNRTSTGPSSGSSKGIMFGTVTDSEDWAEYMGHYFRQIDRALNAALRDSGEPVILAGVEYEVALYRTVSTYPHLFHEGIHGAPNALKGGEMHARSLEALKRHHENALNEVLSEYNHLVGGGRATNRTKEIVTAAHDGRVNKLIVAESLEQIGTMNEGTYEVKAKQGDNAYDLVNDATVQTLCHAGQVLVAPNGKMPDGTPMAAIFRY